MELTKIIPFLHNDGDNSEGHKLTAAEQGKLWATYIGNTMSHCVLTYMLRHVDDDKIKQILELALSMTKQFLHTTQGFFKQENYPQPIGFTEEDVNPNAERIFADEFYLHYLKYAAKAGISLYAIAVPLMSRSDTRAFFTQCNELTVKLINAINELMLEKGILTKPPFIPYPSQVDFIKKQSYLNGFFGHVRPLQALEITHLYDNIENITTSKAVLLAFSQAAQRKQTKDYFSRGLGICSKHFDLFTKQLHEEYLSTPPLLDPLVLNSTQAPFSDKLMMFHKLDMFTVRIRAYSNGLSMSARHDVAALYGRLILEVGNFVEDGANIMIDHGWLEQPPQAADREQLVNK